MPRIVQTTVYEFHELSAPAKERARAWFRDGLGHNDWFDAIYRDFEAVCERIGVSLDTRPVPLVGGRTCQESCIYFSGFASQGDGACFEGIYAHQQDALKAITNYAPQDAELQGIARRLDDLQRQHAFALRATLRHRDRYYHEHSMDISVDRIDGLDIPQATEETVTECLRNLARWLYSQLEHEWHYLISDSHADETITANSYTFTENGRRLG
jgi:hypothetical protein